MDFLSDIGFVVPGVASGFLVTTNVNCCFLEPFISNPKAPKELRDKALKEILESLEDKASKIGIRLIYGVEIGRAHV